MEALGSLYGVKPDWTSIDTANKQREQLNAMVEQNPQLKGIIEQLENYYDTNAERRKEEESPRLSPEIEKFLAEMDKRFREG